MCVKDLNVKPKTMKLLDGNTEEIFQTIGVGKNFLDRTPKAQETKYKVGNWDCSKPNNFCTTKEIIN